MSAEGTAFSIARDPLPTIIALGLTAGSVLLSLVAIFIDVAAGRLGNRTLLHGVAAREFNNFTRNSITQQQQPSSQPPSTAPTPAAAHTAPTTPTATPLDMSTSSDHPQKPHSSANLPESASAVHRQQSKLDNSTPDSSPPSAPPVSTIDLSEPQQPRVHHRGARRRALCTGLARLIFVAVSLAALGLSLVLFTRFYRDGSLSSVASDETNTFTYLIVRQALQVYANSTNRPELSPDTTSFGVGSRFLGPGDVYQPALWRLVAVVTVLVLFCLLGAFLSVVKVLVPSPRTVGVVMMVQSIVVLLVGIIASFTTPTLLPLDGTPIANKWLDRHYADADLLKQMTEERLVGNFFVAAQRQNSTSGPEAIPLSELPGFDKFFCASYDANRPIESMGSNSPIVPSPTPQPSGPESDTTPPAPAPTPVSVPEPAPPAPPPAEPEPEPEPEPEDEEELDEPVSEPVTETTGDRPTQSGRRLAMRQAQAVQRQGRDVKVYEELLMAYMVGKPGGVDSLRALSYMTLPVLTLGSVAAAGMLRTYVLYPLFGAWVATVGVVTVVAVPTAVRIMAVPMKPKRLYQFCEFRYRLEITDHETMRTARMDLAVFVLAVLVGIIHAFRWFRMAERQQDEHEDDGVRLVNFEEVYSKNGNLRW